jgi:hypothetical protein
MVHDDDTGEPPHIGISDEDYPSSGYRSARLPSPEIQRLIIELAQEPGYGANTIRKQLKRMGYQVEVSEVRAVLAAADLDRR